jgi:hypothetical protein
VVLVEILVVATPWERLTVDREDNAGDVFNRAGWAKAGKVTRNAAARSDGLWSIVRRNLSEAKM